ncbi:hypothetical protein Tter_2487 [Thermobaculum terrenum ATCC BAA-798]|uniref:Uncharacterized protein n=1 Tax=Thermobaculum terrenum (strain ATCC BAA-798 / CCMEE 7001 / YNP1) TaxID=525904 RepID=D1CI06_THET1|nr:hypothetical protein Tter_2487 [Thermobaculum terrenum ATCC BAA-798]
MLFSHENCENVKNEGGGQSGQTMDYGQQSGDPNPYLARRRSIK